MAVFHEMVRCGMEILTLLKAFIKKKKSTFISIMLLTTIVVASIISIVSVRDNYKNGIRNALEYADSPDVTAFAITEKLTKEVCEKVERSSLVERVDYYKALITSGASVGDFNDQNAYFARELPEGIRLFNQKSNGFEKSISELNSGEIYLPLGLKSKLDCNVGDIIELRFASDYKEFLIKGFVQEPTQGSMTIGWTQVFISSQDYKELYASYKHFEEEEIYVDATIIRIYQSVDSELSAAKFQRKLNLETKIIDICVGALNTEQTIRYSTLLPDVVTNMVLVFMLFLFVVVLIVMSHSVSTEIEIDYVTFGVLKSQGFSTRKIRTVMILQYLLAEVVGAVVGLIVAILIEKRISAICQMITAVLPEQGMSVGKSVLVIVLVLVVSVVLIFVKTRKVGKISPVRAIAGGHEEIFFDSRFHTPIHKKTLLASLSLRQLTFATRRYLGTIFIGAILVFSMITINLAGNLLASRYALNAMGLLVPDIEIFFKEYDENADESCWEEINKIVESHSKIEAKNAMLTQYISLNGESLMCEMYQYPEYILGILRGREPLYENEILITDMVAEVLEIEMGDEVTISIKDKEDTFIVSGIFQSSNDSGMAFAMNFNGVEKFGGNTKGAYRYYIIEDKSKLDVIAEEINQKYGDFLGINVFDEDNYSIMGEYGAIVDALTLLIYLFSILFSFVVVRMVCTKTFVQERTDIGTLKALGFTSQKLRLSFAIRFLLIAIVGSIFGAIFSVLFSARMLSAAFQLFGVSKVVLPFTVESVLIPTVAICLSFFVFAYFASRKIKKVEVRELVVE